MSDRCPKCGKPYIYVGDPIGDIAQLVCVCPKEYFVNMERGWICPRCNRVNAPWVRQCTCPGGTTPPYIVTCNEKGTAGIK